MGPWGGGVRAHHPNIRGPERKNHDKPVAKMDSAPQKKGGAVPMGPQRGQNLVWGPGGPKKGHFGQLGGGIFVGPILGRFWIFSLWGLLATSQRLKITETHPRGVLQALPTPAAPGNMVFQGFRIFFGS